MDDLLRHKTEIDADLQRVCQVWQKEWATYTPVTLEVLDSLIDFISRGGKRVRGALAMESYFLHGGTNHKVAVGAARVIELINAGLLVMDDIQDNSALRRGGPTVHIRLAGAYGHHYGVAQGINTSMLAMSKAMSELMALPVSATAKTKAGKLLNDDIGVTIAGQVNDIYHEVGRQAVTEQDILNTITWKTAQYTFISPLQLGACLAGVDSISRRLHKYAVNAGIAFQIADDLLGMFGDSRELGKSASDDIREGKVTLLVLYARKQANATQAKVLKEVLGNSKSTEAEWRAVREILQATGARDYAANLAQEYAADAIAALGVKPERFLVELVQLAVNRTK